MLESKVGYSKFIVESKDGSFVPISHRELDNLVGRLMQMCDLIGDVSQRDALKGTIKKISREWLDNEYENVGYDKYEGIKDGAKFIDAESSGIQQIYTKE